MKDLELIGNALEKANQRGVFTLEESAIIFNAVQCVAKEYGSLLNQQGTAKEGPTPQRKNNNKNKN